MVGSDADEGHGTVGRPGNQAVAEQIAEQIKLYFDNSHRVLASIGTQIRDTQLEQWQKEQTLRNHVLDFPEFREISMFDAGGRLKASSRIGSSSLTIPTAAETENGTASAFYVATPTIDADQLPTTTMAVPLQGGSEEPGWIIAEISLEELWRTVDRIKVGNSGYALLLDEHGGLVAHGNPNDKPLIASQSPATKDEQDLATAARKSQVPTDPQRILNSRKEELLAVGAVIDNPSWAVLVEQPTEDAFSLLRALKAQLFVAIGLALSGTVLLGWLWGRSFIQRIFAFTRVTRAIADGRMDERVELSGQDEIRQLGDAFNSMADASSSCRKTSEAGAAGDVRPHRRRPGPRPLASDPEHRQQLQADRQKMFDDAEYRETFKRTVERELVIVKRVLDDLRNIARPMPLERFPVESNRTVADAVEVDAAARGDRGPDARSRSSRPARLHRGGCVRARPRLPQPDHERDPGDGARRLGRRRRRGRAAIACRCASTTRAAAFRRNGCGRSSRTSSRRNAAASAWAWPSPRRSSSSSAGTISRRQRGRQGHDVRARLPADIGTPDVAAG